MIPIAKGEKIVVYDSKKVELGEGTFVEREYIPAMKVTAYECLEHTILARGGHWLKVRGEMHFVAAP
jgi:hypothetical protein